MKIICIYISEKDKELFEAVQQLPKSKRSRIIREILKENIQKLKSQSQPQQPQQPASQPAPQ
jgi:metal-responsive CopG/Arc/MetJ family transcriptional regulator